VRGYLLDENLPDRLLPTTRWPIVHARAFGPGLTDTQLWTLAAREHWALVSKDADFAARILATGPPPWIVQIRLGNLRLAEFRTVITNLWPQVEALLPAYKLINVYREHIEAVGDG